MKKSIFTLFLICLLLVAVSGNLSARQDGEVITRATGPENIVGFDFPTYGWAQYNDQNQLTGWQGINYGLGYSQINYFDPLVMGEFNPFWEFGTTGVIVPYLAVGGEYPYELEGDRGYLSFRAGIGTHFMFGFTTVSNLDVPKLPLRFGISYNW